MTKSLDSFKARKQLEVDGRTYTYFSLTEAEKNGLDGVSRLPFSLKVLLENLLRFEDGRSVTADDIKAVAEWLKERRSSREIAYRPARVLMQDFTGVPAVVDLAAMRDATTHLGGDPNVINPLVPVDLVIDHSVMVDYFGTPESFEKNVEMEYERNGERYQFLRWGQEAFENFRVVPPGTGICHQVNLEYLAQTVWTREEDGETYAFPDTLVGTDSHTTMVNGLSVLGWGVGGIEAEAAMLGQPISMLIPEVIGFGLTGRLPEGTTATDLVLTVTQMLRKKGVVGKFVEFFGEGLSNLSLEDQATIGNMAPEYGATCGFFPIDKDTLKYLKATGRDPHRVALVEAYAKAQGMFRFDDTPDPHFTDTLTLDLSTVVPSLAGPKRPQDRVPLTEAASTFEAALHDLRGGKKSSQEPPESRAEARYMDEGAEGVMDVPAYPVEGMEYHLRDGDVVIAAITSCTNTSNPSVLIAAGLLARKAREKGLDVKPWVKTSLAPGSQVVTDYLEKSGLQEDLNALGFDLVGYGCTTCIGNSGPLPEAISATIAENDLVACSVLSGNRNFEGRVNPDVRANYLASPPLVVAYALAGSLRLNITEEPLGEDKQGNAVYLKDIWPSSQEVAEIVRQVISEEMFRTRYGDVFRGDKRWQGIKVEGGMTYAWPPASTYVQNPPFFDGMDKTPKPVEDVEKARILGLFLDSITTDHISPAGAIKRDSPAGDYLVSHQVRPIEFNSYGSRRGNHEVMMRGTFANIRIKNQMLDGIEGGMTRHYPSGEELPIYTAAMRYEEEGVPLVIFAGKEYGTGSSRDWAAKGTRLLGVRAVIAESFERIHRSNLIGMGVLPLVFKDDTSWQSLGIKGDEEVSIAGLTDIRPRSEVTAKITFADGRTEEVPLMVRIDTEDELDYYRHGGILHYVLRNLVSDKEAA
ncbi:aconitate hydratase AcnA [Afifella marina]|uniref:Aconitate hydratase n=1 Tax=Afifella marina DSM 2698 TaxID=1120955 RepID=A0A1G5NQQ3_AFIMA|nr:aconitate hydratase AcnA [Afifella marina]MBK1624703.1 aconitate hydratase AcnA [Afifella marina DSM 2698]MBK1627360.1 aconitate hydratase AcnA [Afifella marina]MBK5915874.1 aconitate hydratase 1 [Afifella marina]RAI20586.1 aconitate hydratase 1 [Afifella marina DSM 2698]SCZ39665.1 aconitate hydratase [Afifella marina DSM 2698]